MKNRPEEKNSRRRPPATSVIAPERISLIGNPPYIAINTKYYKPGIPSGHRRERNHRTKKPARGGPRHRRRSGRLPPPSEAHIQQAAAAQGGAAREIMKEDGDQEEPRRSSRGGREGGRGRRGSPSFPEAIASISGLHGALGRVLSSLLRGVTRRRRRYVGGVSLGRRRRRVGCGDIKGVFFSQNHHLGRLPPTVLIYSKRPAVGTWWRRLLLVVVAHVFRHRKEEEQTKKGGGYGVSENKRRERNT